MSLIAYDNRVLGAGEFTAGTGTWATSPPITNMGTDQVPTPYASVTPSAGDFTFDWQSQDSAGSADSFTARVLALLGHSLPDGAEVEFLDGATSLGTVTVENVPERPQNTYLVLGSDRTMDTLTVSVTSAGADPVRIASLWAGAAFIPNRGIAIAGYGEGVNSNSILNAADTTVWTSRRGSYETVRFTFPGMTYAESRGTSMPNWRGVARLSGSHSPVIIMPQISKPEDAIYGYFTDFDQTTPLGNGYFRGGATVRESC